MKRLLFISFILAMTVSCTEKVDWNLEYQQMAVIVVDGKITNIPGVHEVKLTLPVYEQNGTPEPVTGAVVRINDGSDLRPLAEDPERPGVYLTGSDFAGIEKKGHQLRIRYRDRIITAVSFMPEAKPIQRMRIYPVQDNPPLYEAYISDQNGPGILRMELDWSHVPGYDTLPGDQTHALIYHYTLESVDVNRIFPPDREHVRFPPGTIVFREKESISREYAEFLRGMLSETDWRGGVFDVMPGNVHTNLSEGAIGYFTAGAITQDTVVVD
jgi:hypothetical protein